MNMANPLESTDLSKNEISRKIIEQYVKDGYKIFIDTCSLLEDSVNIFWQSIIPYLHQYSSKIIIPLRCIEELQKHQKDISNPNLANDALNSLKVIKQLLAAEYVEIRGESTDNFADNVFIVVFTKFRMTEKLLLITQDRDLSEDILKLNESKAVTHANPIHVKKINKYGFLSNIYPKGYKPAVKRKADGKFHKINEKFVPEEEKFQLYRHLTNIRDDKMPLTYLPSANESVYVYTDKWLTIQLKDKLGEGGEAIIYATNTPYVAKIYKEDTNTKRKYEKINLMLSKHIDCPGICYPVASLYNLNKEFIGFLMPAAKGKELQRGIFLVKQLFLKNFPGWKKRDTVELCITILEKIKYLHDRNIIMGDINPANILVVSPSEVYFVDTDSYQIEDFPCPVGTINYTAPEIQRKHFGDFLRTFGNENFAVATLLFMIMLPGKPPYSQQGGEDPIANIINMNFSYPFGDSSNKKTPDGPWRYIWSHLTYDLKEAFYTTFRKGEAHSTETTRLSVDEWLSIFKYYLELLDSGKYGKQDEMSEELYPTRHKKNDKFTYVRCNLCNTEVPENHSQNGICRACLNKGESYKCSKCGKEIIYTNYQKYIKHAKKYDTCHECFEFGHQVKTTITCSDCGRSFDITNSEWDFYKSKGYDIPKRCKYCRDAKKTMLNQSQPYYRSSMNSSNNNTKNSGSFCFITTAVCEYFGKTDDCIELTTLRNYRDSWLCNQPGGADLIAEYYNIAPLIVSQMKQSEFYPEYCEKLLSQYINPCLKLISEQKYNECKELYSKMFYYMKSEFIK